MVLVLILMGLNSIGVYGFLSRAHLEQVGLRNMLLAVSAVRAKRAIHAAAHEPHLATTWQTVSADLESFTRQRLRGLRWRPSVTRCGWRARPCYNAIPVGRGLSFDRLTKGGTTTMQHREHRELQEYRDRHEVDEHWPQIEMPAVAAATRYAGKHKQKQMQAENDIQPQLK